jgi:hypothetical protein
MIMAKAVFETSEDTIAIAAILSETPIGGVVTYERLNKVIGKDSQEHRYLISTARMIVQNAERKVFAAVKGVGYQRLNDSEKIKSGFAHLKKARGSARRAAKDSFSTEYETLSSGDKLRHSLLTTLSAGIVGMTAPAHQKMLQESIIAGSNNLIAAGKSAAQELKNVR